MNQKYTNVYIKLKKTSRGDPKPRQKLAVSSDDGCWFWSTKHYNTEEVLQVAVRCLHAQIEHVNLFKIAVPVAKLMHFPVQQISINKSVTVTGGFTT